MSNELLNYLMEDSQFVDIMASDVLEEVFDATKARQKCKTEMRKIKARMREAKLKAISGDKQASKKIYNECRHVLKKLKVEANKIPNDNIIEYAHHGGMNGPLYVNSRTGGPDKCNTFSKKETLYEIDTLLERIDKEDVG